MYDSNLDVPNVATGQSVGELLDTVYMITDDVPPIPADGAKVKNLAAIDAEGQPINVHLRKTQGGGTFENCLAVVVMDSLHRQDSYGLYYENGTIQLAKHGPVELPAFMKYEFSQLPTDARITAMAHYISSILQDERRLGYSLATEDEIQTILHAINSDTGIGSHEASSEHNKAYRFKNLLQKVRNYSSSRR